MVVLISLSIHKLIINVSRAFVALQGVAFPAMHAILGKWSPPKERTIMSALTYSGKVHMDVCLEPVVLNFVCINFLI